MSDLRSPKRVISGELQNAGKREPGRNEKEWADYMAEDHRLFGITGYWSIAALDPGGWYSTIRERGCRCMAARAKEEEKTSKHRQRKKKAD